MLLLMGTNMFVKMRLGLLLLVAVAVAAGVFGVL